MQTELGYDKDPSMGAYATKQYNGNISTMLWKSEGDRQRRRYTFTYDNTNRLTAANFSQYASGSGGSAVFDVSAGVDFSENGITYDDNGNIKTLARKGLILNSSPVIDQLTYAYYSYEDRPYKVSDAGVNTAANKLGDFRDGTNPADDYNYNNGNGSLTTDFNKGINSIEYWRTAELPKIITFDKGTISYTHDDLGNKLKKITVENPSTANGNHTITTTTTYLGGSVYESKATSPADADNPDYTNRLLFIAQEEGRIRPLYTNASTPNTPTGFVYDYFIKDHLGNIRMVLTDENQPADMYPPATMEDAAIAAEERYYGNLSSTVQGKPGGFDSDTGNHKVAELNYSNAARRIGPNALLRVMSGDKVSISVDAFYSSTGQNNSNSSVVADVVASLVSAFGGGSSTAMDPTGHYTIGDRNITSFNTTSYPDISSALKSDDPNTDNGKPKAYVNWILFDEQFNMVRSSSATRQVDMAADTKQQMAYTDIAMHSNGYLYVYLSNESPMNVFFDNFQVTHRHGPILEEMHYYPFGLTMAGISSKALNNAPTNRYKYNGIEQNNDLDLNMYDAFYRNLDPQIGRFWQIDPEAEMLEGYSPYVSMRNNPINNTDPLGDFATRFGAWWYRLWNGGGKIEQNEYGEWSVLKVKPIYSDDGSVIYTPQKYYGKGRDQYSATREALIRDAEIYADIQINGEKSMFQMYESSEEAGRASLTYIGLAVPVALKAGTNAVNAGNNVSKVLTRGERLSMLKEKLLNAPMPKNPKEALKLINKTLDKIEKTHAGPNDRMYGILDNKYVTLNTDGSMTALTRGHRIEIQSNGSFSIFERNTGNLFLAK